MLGKLLKYDLRYVYKTLGVYYILTIVATVCGTLILKIPNPPFIIKFIGEILSGGGFGLSIGLMINAFTRTWARFRQNLYGDEAYLTHTLPISRLQLFTSKFISSVIILLLSLVIIAAVMFIQTPEATSSIFSTDDFAIFASALIIQAVFSIMCGFTGIIVGHRFDTARNIISAIAGIGCYLAVSVLLIGIVFLLSAFDPELSELITRGQQPSLPTLINFLWIGIATYTITTAGLFAINVNLLNRGVNVE